MNSLPPGQSAKRYEHLVDAAYRLASCQVTTSAGGVVSRPGMGLVAPVVCTTISFPGTPEAEKRRAPPKPDPSPRLSVATKRPSWRRATAYATW
jgi:hypothetical protein